jgi:pyruvate/2-oxoglutarate dehydrogenase complex dihydrolipoamide dehydrogenase (E3) component
MARRASDYGVETGPVSVDMEVVRRRKREIVEQFRSGSRSGIEGTDGLDLLEGDASFIDDRTLEVSYPDGSSQQIAADTIVINTGARPFIPPIEGISAVDYLDSTSIMELDIIPEHLVVLGGGYVGLEFGQMFRRFGSEVTIVQRGDQVLQHEDRDVAGAVVEVLEEDGIDVVLSTEATAVRQTGDGAVTLTLEGDANRRAITGSHLLVATGREPATDTLDLSAAGVATDRRGHIETNGRLETTGDGIYAIGDVKGGPQFTHISYDDYRILKDNLLNGAGRDIDGRLLSYTVFLDPQLGRVGLSEEQARQTDQDVQVAHLPMTHVARALETDQTRGFMKAVVDADSEQILGATIFGPEGGEIMSVVQMAMMGNVPYTEIRDSPFAHPTYAESLNNLFMSLE